jgi:hypothetical protein
MVGTGDLYRDRDSGARVNGNGNADDVRYNDFMSSPVPPRWLKTTYESIIGEYGDNRRSVDWAGEIMRAIVRAADSGPREVPASCRRVRSSGNNNLEINYIYPIILTDQLVEVVLYLIEALAMDRWYRKIFRTEGYHDGTNYDDMVLQRCGQGVVNRSKLTFIDGDVVSGIHNKSIRRMLLGYLFYGKREAGSRDAYDKAYAILMPINDIRTHGLIELVYGDVAGSLSGIERHIADFRSAIDWSCIGIVNPGRLIRPYMPRDMQFDIRRMWTLLIFFRAFSALNNAFKLVTLIKNKSCRDRGEDETIGTLAFKALDDTSRAIEAYTVIKGIETILPEDKERYWAELERVAGAIRANRYVPVYKVLESNFYNRERIASRIVGWLVRFYDDRPLGIRDDGS